MSFSATTVMNKQSAFEYDSFDTIYNSYFNRVFSYIRYHIRIEANAYDVTAKTFERVLCNLHRYDANKAPFSSWIFTIASNELKKYYREQSRHQWLSCDDIQLPISNAANPEEITIKYETYQQLYLALSLLKKRERNIISLKFGGQLTNREIAKILNLSESNVGVLLYRSIQKLRKELENRKVR